jgi:titin
MFDRLNGVDSAWAGTYILKGTTTPSVYSYAYIATPLTVKSSSTQLEVGAVLTAGGVGSGGGGARLSRLAAVVSYNPPLIIPVAPSNLIVSQNSTNTVVTLTWSDNSSNESGFVLERSTNGTTFSALVYISPNTPRYSISTQTAGTYYYRVRAYSTNAYSGYSNSASTTIVLPVSPSNITALASSTTNSIVIHWKDNSSNETSFILEKSTNGTTFATLVTLPANTVAYTESNQTPGTYYYQVRSYNASGYSVYSNVASVTVLPLEVVPAAPSNLSISTASSTNLLYWSDNSNNELGFMVEKSFDGMNFTLYGSTTAPYFVETNKTTGTYYYRVRAYNSTGFSAYSNIVTLSILSSLPAPSAITAGIYNSNSVGIAWTDNSSDELGFLIERSVNGTTTWVQVATSSYAFFSDDNLTVGTYYYRVRAYNGLGYSAYSLPSLPVSVVPPVAPSAITSGLYNSNSIGISWTDNSSDELGFLVERSNDGTLWTQFGTSTYAFFSDDNLQPGLYLYRVRAYNGLGFSAYSGTSTAIFIHASTTNP